MIAFKAIDFMELALSLDMCSQIPLMSVERICTYLSMKIHHHYKLTLKWYLHTCIILSQIYIIILILSPTQSITPVSEYNFTSN